MISLFETGPVFGTNWGTCNHSFCCGPLGSVSAGPGLLQQRRPPLSAPQSHTPSLPDCLRSGALASSCLAAESNVTGPGCSLLPPPSEGLISAESYHQPGKRVRRGQWGNKEGDVEMWAANLKGRLLLTGLKPTFGPVLLDLSGCGVIKLQTVGETKQISSYQTGDHRLKREKSQFCCLIYV